MGSPGSDRVSRVPSYSGSGWLRKGFGYGAFTPCGGPFQTLPLPIAIAVSPSYNPKGQAPWFGLFRVRSPLLAESRLISFPPGTEMFHFPGCRFNRPIEFRRRFAGMTPQGLPHSDIFGSRAVCASPKLFAAYHVLHRQSVPRHPSHACIRLAEAN